MGTGPTYLIIGNGIAGVTAAEILRAEDSAATIAVIADDPFPVYYRPALKDYLAGRVREDKLWARPRSFYQDQTIYFHADRAVGIQAGQHIVHLQSGRTIGYQRLLLAQGARATRLTCPGTGLVGVTTLRTVADYQKVLAQLHAVRRVVVTGSGTLGLETIETLRHRGLEVTHLLRRQTLWSEVLDATASDLVIQQERRDGVNVLLGEEIAEITGKRGEVDGVVTTSGKHIPCEMVIVAIGIDPIIDFVKSSGIACGRGIKVDGRMQTSAPDIYAAGDVIETSDAMTGRTRPLGQWYPSIQQARAAAYSMLDLLDTNRVFRFSTFYNATFLYGLDFASVGVTTIGSGQGYQEIVADPKPRTYRKVLLKNGVPVGMLSLGDRKQTLAFKRAIDHRVNLSSVASRLLNDDFKLSEWLDAQGVPPAILGVTREGEAAIQAAAYPGGTMAGARGGTAVGNAAALTEAFLVPDPEFARDYRLEEKRLSQTRVITVGRQAGIPLLIDQGTVSRRHAEISYANGQYILRDLGSTNGTFVNGMRLQPQSTYILKPNDHVRFGTTVAFTFVQRGGTSQARKPSPGSVTMAGVTMLHELDKNAVPLEQPILNADGSLLLPGSTIPVPAKIVATFKTLPALITVVGGAARGKNPPQVALLVQGNNVTIGRDEGADIVIADVVVSRYHAQVSPGPDGYYVRDLESSNGVIVNQTRIDNPYRLAHGDRITIGSSIIYFIDLQEAYKMATGSTRSSLLLQKPAAVSRKERIPVPVASGGGVGLSKRATAQELAIRSDETVASMRFCPRCGTANTRIARFCAACSTPLGA
jgi:NADPH-dependent 2,4-dienoyl-CoA reductase/sulfur reductase-like enzyme/pSer/pThr/pTyr-binding forkhead associated (FHA) protein